MKRLFFKDNAREKYEKLSLSLRVLCLFTATASEKFMRAEVQEIPTYLASVTIKNVNII